MCLTLVVNLLDSTTEIKKLLSYQCTASEPVCSDKASMYLRITLHLYIIRIRRIKYGFMWVTSQILNTEIDTLETSKSRCQSLGL